MTGKTVSIADDVVERLHADAIPGAGDVEAVLVSDAERIIRAALSPVEAREAALVEALSEYGAHQMPCLLAQWHGGRPTKDGGYETRYGNVWYPRGHEPWCTCGLSAALAAYNKGKEG